MFGVLVAGTVSVMFVLIRFSCSGDNRLPLQQEFGEKLVVVRSIQFQQSNATAKAKATFYSLPAAAFTA